MYIKVVVNRYIHKILPKYRLNRSLIEKPWPILTDYRLWNFSDYSTLVCRQHDKRVNLLYGYEWFWGRNTYRRAGLCNKHKWASKNNVQMKINSEQKPVKFQIDCGATCNVITPDLVPANNVSVLFLNSSHFQICGFHNMVGSGSCVS